jgi:hypothetical protein
LLDREELYKQIDSNKQDIDNAINLLTENNILIKIKENDNIYYSLNEKYFNDNNI